MFVRVLFVVQMYTDLSGPIVGLCQSGWDCGVNPYMRIMVDVIKRGHPVGTIRKCVSDWPKIRVVG